MKRLTENEIKFINYTKVTPTVIQCDEWQRTIFADEVNEDKSNIDEIYGHAFLFAREVYKVDLDLLYRKCVDDNDAISLEEAAPYLLYTFLKQDQLEDMSDTAVLAWLRDFVYYFGYRKSDEVDARIAQEEALGLFNGTKVIKEWEDGTIYVDNKEE